ncbi:MAG: hypothetical protein RLP44_00810 [Aggregatilineales bacterium]
MRVVFVAVLFSLLLMMGTSSEVAPVYAQDSPNALEVTKSIQGNLTEIDSGGFFTYIIQYRCVGITANCLNVTLTDVLPPELSWAASDVTIFGTIHTSGSSYDPSTGTVTWDFISPLPAGSTGEIRLRVRFPPGTTPDGSIALNSATISADNPSNPNNPVSVDSNTVPITANADNELTADKVLLTGGALNNNTTYRVRLCRPQGGNDGMLNMEDITMVDTLPAGATFVSATGGGVYDAGPPQTVSWALPDYNVNGSRCIERDVVVRFEDTNGFNVGDPVVNNVDITGTPIGETPVTLNASNTHIIGNPTPNSIFTKNGSVNEAVPGDSVRYGLRVQNNGTTALDTYVVTDPIPPQVNVTQIHTGTVVSVGRPIAIRYQTNLNATFTPVPGSPFTNNQTVAVAALGLAANEYVTVLQWDFATTSPVPVGFQTANNLNDRFGFTAVVLDIDRNGNPVIPGQIVDNIGSLDFGIPGDVRTITENHAITITDLTAQPRIDKTASTLNSVTPGEIVTFEIEVRNDNSATTPLVNPVVADLLDANIIFVDFTFDPLNSGNTPPAAPMPILEQIDNYNGTGRTLLRWRWDGASAYDFLAGEEVRISYRVEISATAQPGQDAVTNQAFIVDWDDSVPRVNCPSVLDANDLNGDGLVTDTICNSNTVGLDVNSQAVMESAKWVRGELDTDWVRFPDVGLTSPGGTFDYRLELFNAGNVPMTDITMIEILPFVGDSGVIDSTPRLTQWTPVLDGAVVPSGGGVTVEYSTETNPCRPSVVPSGPVGCAAPNWTTIPPADISTVASLRFQLCCTIQPGQQFEIILPMRAPISAQPGDTAWNSFGFIATREDTGDALLATEPFKVGITTYALPLNGTKTLIDANAGINVLTYSMVWLNNGNNFPVDAQISDTLPAGTSMIDGSLSCEARGTSTQISCAYNPATNTIFWQGRVGEDPGATSADNANNEIVISFRVQIPASMNVVTNQASSIIDADLDGDFTDENPQVSVAPSNSSTWDRDRPTSGVQPTPNSAFAISQAIETLRLSKSVSPPFLAPGETATWVITVTNPSTIPLNNVMVTDNIPAGLQIVSATSSSGSVSVNGSVITFTQGVLSPTETVTITIQTQYNPADASNAFIITNNAVLSVDGTVVDSTSASFLQVNALPQTGQSPWSAPRALLLTLMPFAVLGGLLFAILRLLKSGMSAS